MKKLVHKRSTAAGILAAQRSAEPSIDNGNTPTGISGPPSDYGPDKNELETVYGQPEDYKPADNLPVPVYGPPSGNGGSITRRAFTAAGALAVLAFLARCNTPTCVYGPPPDYDPDENELVTVYGPPEDYEPDDSKDDADTQYESITYDPEENELVDVYGPPEPEDFEPQDNVPEALYGPPEDLESIANASVGD